MNNVTLIGNLVKDFELRQTTSGSFVASNRIAVRNDRKEADGTYKSDFFNLYCFGNQADFASKYLRKGDRVAVSGSVHVRDYTDAQGVQRTSVEIRASSIESLTQKQDAAQPATTPAPTATTQPTEQNLDAIDLPDDDLPF